MHVPDGFLDLPTSIATGAIALGAVVLAGQRSRHELRAAGIPLAGLTAVFVFAAQMVNFPVGLGTSGHLMGGALAAVLVGPWTAMLCLTVVLGVQAVFFADGGLTALGTNIVLIAVVSVVVGYAVAKALTRLLPRRPRSAVPAAAAGAFISVPAAALVFVVLYAIGGATPIPLTALAGAMLGWHVLIGIGEAVITAAVVGAVVATRPDLVYLVRHVRPALVMVTSEDGQQVVSPAPTSPFLTSTAPTSTAPASNRAWAAMALAVCLVIASGVSLLASAHPDGLEFVAAGLGFEGAALDPATAGWPTADYVIAGLGDWSTALAGVLGVALVGLISWGLLALLARQRAPLEQPRT